MAIPLLTILKAAAPYIAQVATATIPAFTSKSDSEKEDQVVAKQIEELQEAATQNAQSVHLLAEKLQLTIESLETAAKEAEKKVSTYKLMVVTSLGLSIVSLAVCFYLLGQ